MPEEPKQTPIQKTRNPKRFKVGDRVRVVEKTHRDFGKVGVIEFIKGVDDDSGKPRAVIKCTMFSQGAEPSYSYLHVSLPNLAVDVETEKP